MNHLGLLHYISIIGLLLENKINNKTLFRSGTGFPNLFMLTNPQINEKTRELLVLNWWKSAMLLRYLTYPKLVIPDLDLRCLKYPSLVTAHLEYIWT
jgi:hypothetical protein